MTTKHLIAAGVLSMTAAIVPAQIPDQNPIQMQSFSAYVPAAFSAEKKPMLTFFADNRVTLYDASFQQTSTVSIRPFDSSLDLGVAFEWRDFITSWSTETKSLMVENISLDEVENRILADAKANQIQSIPNGQSTIFISDAPENVYQTVYHVWIERKSAIIPSTWYLFTPSATNAQAGSLFKVTGSGTPSFTILPELHTVFGEHQQLNRAPLMQANYVSYDDNSVNNPAPVYLTQTLFNADKACEYLRPILSTSRLPADYFLLPGHEYPDGVIGQYISYQAAITGFEIMAEDGSVIQSVNFPENMQLIDGATEATILTIGGTTYLKFPVREVKGYDYYGSSYELLYRVDPSNSGVRSIGAPIPSTAVYPTTLRRGTPLNVSTGADARCSVYDLNGRLRYATTVPADSPVQVPTSGLAPGMNIVNVTSPQSTTSTKIIVQ